MKKPKKANPAAKPSAAAKRAPNRKSIDGVRISPDTRVRLYERARSLPKKFKQDSGLLLPFVTYFQDPFVAKRDPRKAFDEEVLVAWEPGLTDGPTSSRFAIVDYNADTGRLEPPAVWGEGSQAFAGVTGVPLDAKAAGTLQFHQVSVWALLQCALAFFEDASALGRTIPWAFEGNRLIVVPHAGYGENAYYDRASKSLQFYYFDSDEGTVYTCLSSDIVHHEFGHAVLDGIRPLFNESSQPQTAAFHEFMGDLSAILLTLKNKKLRQQMAESSGGKFEKATTLSSLAEQFGRAVKGRPYLRTARNKSKMSQMVNEMSPHRLSEVLTGAMFDALIALGQDFIRSGSTTTPRKSQKPKTPVQAFWLAADRMQRTAIQPLDLLPPVEVTFRDYALAVCRSQRLSDPLDPADYYGMLIKVFRKREILSAEDVRSLKEPGYLYDRLDLSVRHNIDEHLAFAGGGLPFSRRQPRGSADPGPPRLLRRRPLRRQEAVPAEPAAAAPDRPPVRLARGGPVGRPALRPVRRAHHHDAVRRHARVQRERQRALVDEEARLGALRRQAPAWGKDEEKEGAGWRPCGKARRARRRCSTCSPPRLPRAASARCWERRMD